MPRWLKLLALAAIVLASVVALGYLVLEWRVQDPLEVRVLSVKGVPGDTTSTLTYEVRNASRYPVRILDYSWAGRQKDDFPFYPAQRNRPLVLRPGSATQCKLEIKWNLPATGEEDVMLYVSWAPSSARWLAPLFDTIDRVYRKARPGSKRFMPEASGSHSTFTNLKNAVEISKEL